MVFVAWNVIETVTNSHCWLIQLHGLGIRSCTCIKLAVWCRIYKQAHLHLFIIARKLYVSWHLKVTMELHQLSILHGNDRHSFNSWNELTITDSLPAQTAALMSMLRFCKQCDPCMFIYISLSTKTKLHGGQGEFPQDKRASIQASRWLYPFAELGQVCLSRQIGISSPRLQQLKVNPIKLFMSKGLSLQTEESLYQLHNKIKALKL